MASMVKVTPLKKRIFQHIYAAVCSPTCFGELHFHSLLCFPKNFEGDFYWMRAVLPFNETFNRSHFKRLCKTICPLLTSITKPVFILCNSLSLDYGSMSAWVFTTGGSVADGSCSHKIQTTDTDHLITHTHTHCKTAAQEWPRLPPSHTLIWGPNPQETQSGPVLLTRQFGAVLLEDRRPAGEVALRLLLRCKSAILHQYSLNSTLT